MNKKKYNSLKTAGEYPVNQQDGDNEKEKKMVASKLDKEFCLLMRFPELFFSVFFLFCSFSRREFE